MCARVAGPESPEKVRLVTATVAEAPVPLMVTVAEPIALAPGLFVHGLGSPALVRVTLNTFGAPASAPPDGPSAEDAGASAEAGPSVLLLSLEQANSAAAPKHTRILVFIVIASASERCSARPLRRARNSLACSRRKTTRDASACLGLPIWHVNPILSEPVPSILSQGNGVQDVPPLCSAPRRENHGYRVCHCV